MAVPITRKTDGVNRILIERIIDLSNSRRVRLEVRDGLAWIEGEPSSAIDLEELLRHGVCD